MQQERPFQFEIRDIDAHPDWRAAYNDQVPLLMAGDRAVCRYFLDMQGLRDWLAEHDR